MAYSMKPSSSLPAPIHDRKRARVHRSATPDDEGRGKKSASLNRTIPMNTKFGTATKKAKKRPDWDTKGKLSDAEKELAQIRRQNLALKEKSQLLTESITADEIERLRNEQRLLVAENNRLEEANKQMASKTHLLTSLQAENATLRQTEAMVSSTAKQLALTNAEGNAKKMCLKLGIKQQTEVINDLRVQADVSTQKLHAKVDDCEKALEKLTIYQEKNQKMCEQIEFIQENPCRRVKRKPKSRANTTFCK